MTIAPSILRAYPHVCASLVIAKLFHSIPAYQGPKLDNRLKIHKKQSNLSFSGAHTLTYDNTFDRCEPLLPTCLSIQILVSGTQWSLPRARADSESNPGQFYALTCTEESCCSISMPFSVAALSRASAAAAAALASLADTRAALVAASLAAAWLPTLSRACSSAPLSKAFMCERYACCPCVSPYTRGLMLVHCKALQPAASLTAVACAEQQLLLVCSIVKNSHPYSSLEGCQLGLHISLYIS